MASQVVLQALGLNTQPNTLSVPDGSLSEASNIIIRRDNVIESRRGFKLDGDSFGSSSDTLKQLFVYKDNILRHYSSSLEFEDGTNNDGTRKFTSFSGSYSEPETGLRMKSIQANGNFYFTTSSGIKKISAASGDDLSSSSGYITNAGGVKAVDMTASLTISDGSSTGFLAEDSAVAYRAVWAIKDANNNLILGTPSQQEIVYNYLINLLLRDYNRVLGALDDIGQSTSLISDETYISTLLLSESATATDLKTNILALATKIDTDILYADDNATAGNAPITITGVTVPSNGTLRIALTPDSGALSDYFSIGSNIYLAGFTAGSSSSTVINGARVLTDVQAAYIEMAITGVTAADSPWAAVTGATISSYEYRNITTTAGTLYATPLSSLTITSPPTNEQLKTIQENLDRIIIQLQDEPTTVIPSALMTAYIDPLDITTTANVTLDINIPDDVTADHFLQLYRSVAVVATETTSLVDLSPGDEMRLVYEAYPTSAELSASTMTVEDITPDDFLGAYLYSNEETGEGALQSNEVPPYAKDINAFKNSVFYANTKTRHKKLFSLLGVTEMLTDYDAGTTPKITISNGTDHNTYSFIKGVQEVTDITVNAGATGATVAGLYFTINSAEDEREYYVWYTTGASTDPAVSGRTGIKVVVQAGDADTVVASKTSETLSRYINDFTTSVVGRVITVTNVNAGYTTDVAVGTTSFTKNVTTAGKGENASNKEVLLSSSVSPAIAVDETARSLVRVINQNADESIYAYYYSGPGTVPGKMLLESRTLSDDPFYIVGNNANTGASFSPDISPLLTINSITTGALGVNVITTSAAHGMVDGDQVLICNTTTTPVVDGLYTIAYLGTTTFSIDETITVGDAVLPVGVAIRAVDAEVSSNETTPNRIFYSKTSQPEAVPIVNYFDVGASDKAILRIFPLRDSLFVFKEDGLYRISGESAPFSQGLFDSSYILVAPDSLAVVGSQIYGWTTQGISAVSEGGVTPAISRPIDVDILKLASAQYPSFSTATFGVGYESDNAYLVWTLKKTTDDVATICYRYSTLTNSWTTFDKTNSCGMVSEYDDKLYLGAGDTNYMEQERKEYSRTDYADREYSLSLTAGNYFDENLKFTNIDNIEVGDVLVQEQQVTVYGYNQLLKRLDADNGVGDTDYYSTLIAEAGDDMRAKLVALAQKLDADAGVGSTNYESSIANYSGSISTISVANPTVITTSGAHSLLTNRYVALASTNSNPTVNGNFTITVTGASTFTVPEEVLVGGTTGTYATQVNTFEDQKACFNIIITKLNADSGVSFSNYQEIDNTTIQEGIVTAIDKNRKQVTLNNTLEFVVGDIIHYKAIQSLFTYSPQTLGDPLGFKQLREATVMFDNKAFTNATLSFATDLLPAFIEIPFNGDGNGIFGYSKFGTGFFGGGSNGAPFRTYIPRNCQRCRYIRTKFKHKIAREQYAVYGITLTGEISQSSRAYR